MPVLLAALIGENSEGRAEKEFSNAFYPLDSGAMEIICVIWIIILKRQQNYPIS
jgi:hypothetical protein